MKYMLLLHGDSGAWNAMGSAAQEAWMGAHAAAEAEARRRGIYLGCEALKPATSARFVRVRSGKTITTDGAFAESKELLGGYYLLDCPTEQDALEIAAMIPDATNGFIEVRAINEDV
jgi:hypothetical protein